MSRPELCKRLSIHEEIAKALANFKLDKEPKKLDYSSNTYKDLLPHKSNADVTNGFLQEIMKIILSYVQKSFDRRNKIVDFHHPHQFLDGIEGFDLSLPEKSQPLEQILVDCQDTLKYGVKTGHPRFFNQLSSGLDIISLAADFITSTANTNMFTFEIAPVFIMMEEVTLARMRTIIGWESGDGIFSPGGSVNNLYSAMMARQKYFPDVKKHGMSNCQQLVMFSSRHAHYSNKRPACVMGLGMDNAELVDVDANGRMKPCDLERRILEAKDAGKRPFYVTATAGTTVLGAFDPIPEISAICKRHDIWLHIDAAWGGAVLMSKTHRHLIKGVELADSVTWNPHKMMGVVLQCSALLTKHKGLLAECNSMNASYLFQQDKNYDVSYDTGDKTIQCGRHVDVFKFWLAWKAKGDSGFENHVNRSIELAQYLLQRVKSLHGFEMVMIKPCYTNVCFWYYPKSIRNITDDQTKTAHLNKVAPYIKTRMMESGTTMVGYQPLDHHVNFFRFVVSNTAARKEDIDFMLSEIQRFGEEMSFK